MLGKGDHVMTASPQIEALAENPVWVPTGRAIAAIMATLAELELELGRERRAASRESRRARQPPVTKPPRLTADRREQLRRLAATGEPVRELAAAFGIG
jgi:DNA invertase Pin-like site-specific DNA recombinase